MKPITRQLAIAALILASVTVLSFGIRSPFVFAQGEEGVMWLRVKEHLHAERRRGTGQDEALHRTPYGGTNKKSGV